ncbi:single-stranded-DNA-specific exonuclease RecJ [bacterium]|nr:single-stranded-DNA-specific exonuclease RecJ [bacterium]
MPVGNTETQWLGESLRYRWALKSEPLLSHDDCDSFFQSRLVHLRGTDDKGHLSDKELLGKLPTWELMKDIFRAVGRIRTAMEAGERIVIFGDYDVDGTTSCAMLQLAFAELGYEVEVYIPDRLLEGYGLNPVGLEKIAEQGKALVITVDNGISALIACEKARELGLDVIITDHHEPPPKLPEAFAILNPKQPGCDYPFKMLAGVGVAFYLLIALRAELRTAGHPRADKLNLKKFLDFVAIGTIADVAPLNGVNHILCRVGLTVIFDHVMNNERPGLSHLLRLAGWKADNGAVDATDVGFKIGPRLNAAGRLGSAMASVELMVTTHSVRALELAEFLHGENSARQELEKKAVEQALKAVSQWSGGFYSVVLRDPEWHAGVVGLVASRVAENLNKPTLILTEVDGKLKGSGRSIAGFDLYNALSPLRDKFVSFGGHGYAVGMTLKPEDFDWLKESFESSVRKALGEKIPSPKLEVDGIVPVGLLSERLCVLMDTLEPFGAENPRPKWLIRRVKLGHSKRIGQAPNSKHARVWLDDSASAPLTAFGLASEIEQFVASKEVVDLVVEGRLSRWGGRVKPELRIIDLAVSN